MDLSVIIPARNEEWLNRTVADVLEHAKAQTEIIVMLDGAWPSEPLAHHPRVTVIHQPTSIGQRASYNLGAKVSTAEYVMKLDAHCSVADGFDVALIQAARELGPDVVQVPSQKNLHVYDWVCEDCQRRNYQRALEACDACGSTNLRREVVWKPKRGVHTKRWRFDSDLKFGYWGGGPDGDLTETMSCLGACWFLRRDYHHALGGLDERHGSWGQVGTELGCKAWLSGGRLVTNQRTWFAHFFRVGGQKFPYPITGEEQERARTYSRDVWLNNKWPGQVKPLKWLIEKFAPVPGWTEEQIAGLPPLPARVADGPSVGVVYYSDGRGDAAILGACREQLARVAPGPIVWVTLGRDGDVTLRGHHIVMRAERGYLTMFRQILAGLEALDTEWVFFAEHDVLYHPSHFEFTPPADDRVFYNQHVWKVDAESGRALHYRCSQTSGLCGYRDVLIEHYRKRIAMVEAHGFSRKMGFEPGTHHRPERVDDLTSETWMSAYPNIDIRHGHNLTPSRWKREQFRNQKYTEGWTEGSGVPGWGTTRGRFREFLQEVSGAVQQAVA